MMIFSVFTLLSTLEVFQIHLTRDHPKYTIYCLRCAASGLFCMEMKNIEQMCPAAYNLALSRIIIIRAFSNSKIILNFESFFG